MNSLLFRIYDLVVLGNPRAWLGVIVLLGIIFGFQAQNFKLDASADSLVLENDEDLRYYRATNKVYGSDDFLVITYTPFEGLMSESSLNGLRELEKDLEQFARLIEKNQTQPVDIGEVQYKSISVRSPNITSPLLIKVIFLRKKGIFWLLPV